MWQSRWFVPMWRSLGFCILLKPNLFRPKILTYVWQPNLKFIIPVNKLAWRWRLPSHSYIFAEKQPKRKYYSHFGINNNFLLLKNFLRSRCYSEYGNFRYLPTQFLKILTANRSNYCRGYQRHHKRLLVCCNNRRHLNIKDFWWIELAHVDWLWLHAESCITCLCW